ncbi:MAG: 3'-5' exonuclease [Synechococcaceae cyanobacterium]
MASTPLAFSAALGGSCAANQQQLEGVSSPLELSVDDDVVEPWRRASEAAPPTNLEAPQGADVHASAVETATPTEPVLHGALSEGPLRAGGAETRWAPGGEDLASQPSVGLEGSIATAHGVPPFPSAVAFISPRGDSPPDPLPTPPETLLILDTETTALRPDDGQCIEVGAVLFQVPHRAVLTQVSFLLPCDSNPAEAVNGIPAAVTRLRQPWQPALACFQAMVAQADALLAHNASFDRQWFGQGVLPSIDKPWICSMEDIRWPVSLGLRSIPSVQSLALAYGVPVWAAHRALTDCTYLVQVFQRCVDLEQLLAAALEPRALMRAEVSYADRHLAREAGFRWDQPVARAWTRRLSHREAQSLPFAVHPVEASSPGG